METTFIIAPGSHTLQSIYVGKEYAGMDLTGPVQNQAHAALLTQQIEQADPQLMQRVVIKKDQPNCFQQVVTEIVSFAKKLFSSL